MMLLLRSKLCDTVGANIAEGNYAHSRADFIAKFEIALKETNETSRWLEMLYRRKYISEAEHKRLERKCSTIRVLLIKSITTAKKNNCAAGAHH